MEEGLETRRADTPATPQPKNLHPSLSNYHPEQTQKHPITKPQQQLYEKVFSCNTTS